MTETPNPHIVDADTLTGEMRPIRRAVLSLGSAALVFSRRESLRTARFLLAPLLFCLGMFSFFRTVDHFRQFAWMLTIGAVPALSRWRAARMAEVIVRSSPLARLPRAGLTGPAGDVGLLPVASAAGEEILRR